MAITSSPTDHPDTSGPTSSMTPAASIPGTSGDDACKESRCRLAPRAGRVHRERVHPDPHQPQTGVQFRNLVNGEGLGPPNASIPTICIVPVYPRCSGQPHERLQKRPLTVLAHVTSPPRASSPPRPTPAPTPPSPTPTAPASPPHRRRAAARTPPGSPARSATHSGTPPQPQPAPRCPRARPSAAAPLPTASS